ncbi:MAG TPA: LLM class F420-dependent oxidoreductase [Candidatus Eisenbacteria bacterium]|nr:LLM class F420-dependent oxidoreductase [Candidatus Eisenbacteria bacterium]
MSSVPEFGTGLPAIQQIPSRVRPWEQEVDGAKILDAARAAEAAGFAWVSCSDHPAIPVSRAQAMGPTWYDAGSTLAFVAGVTTRIRLMPHVLVLPYRHPLVIAKQYGTLDHLSAGRVIVGVGSGHLKPEFATLRADYENRGKITDEYLRALAAAWEHDVAHFDGEFISFRDMMVWPRPVQKPRPPFWVGGNSNAAVKRAARLADGWIPWELTAEDFAAKAAYARHLRHDAGRSDAFQLVAPLAAPAGVIADKVLADVNRWREAGATAFHVGVGADSWPQYLDRLAWFGRSVIARVS